MTLPCGKVCGGAQKLSGNHKDYVWERKGEQVDSKGRRQQSKGNFETVDELSHLTEREQVA